MMNNYTLQQQINPMHGKWLISNRSAVLNTAKISRIFALLYVQIFCYFRCMKETAKISCTVLISVRWAKLESNLENKEY